MAELSPKLRAFVDQVGAGAAEREADGAFVVMQESLCYLRACTSLDDADATHRANLVPSGTSHGWQLCTGEGLAPVPCADQPDTHRHLLFEC